MVLARLAPASPPSLNRRGGGGGAFSRLLSCRQVAFILTCLYITCLVVAFWSISRLHSSHDVSFSSGFQMMNLEMILQELAGAPPIISSTATSTTTTSKTLRASLPERRAPKEEVLAQAPPTSGILAQIDASLDAWYKSILVKMESSSVLANAKSCRRVSPSTDSREEFLYYYSLDPLAACRTTSSTTRRKKIIYFNPHARPRLVCGHEVPANGGTLELDQPCLDEPSRLFPVIPSVETAGQLPPTTLRFNDPHKKTRVQPFPDCNIPCHSGGSFGVLGTRTVDGTPWKFHFSMEGAQYYSNLKIRELAHVENYFYSTTSFRSEVPLPYFSYAEYDIQNPNGVVDFHRAEKAAVFLARNCGSKSNREDLVKALQASPHFRVDSLSQCLHNAELPPGLNGLGNKNTVMHHYLFYLAFENQREEGLYGKKMNTVSFLSQILIFCFPCTFFC
jgi:Glycosyltransferase family 10 (fucosyltransferase) C-term